jgi:hypothetical protein
MPEPGNPQSLNRYSYVLNNPMKSTDPSGHAVDVGLGEGASEYLWWDLFHPDMPVKWWLGYYASALPKHWVAWRKWRSYGQDIVREAARYDIPAADLFSIVRQEAANPTKTPALFLALLGQERTLGLTEVSVRTARGLIKPKDPYLPGPTGRTALVLVLGLSERYSIRAAAAAYKQASDVAKKVVPDLPESLRRFYVLVIYNRGEEETLREIRDQGVGAFTPEAVGYIKYVEQHSPGQAERCFWALVSSMVN